MIAITNESGETLQLFEGTSLVTEQAVAWLTDDELPPEYSYPIDVPLNENNKRFVGYAYRIDAAIPRGVMPVTVELEGVLYRRCQFSFKLQSGKLNGYLKIDSAEVYDKLRKLSLLEALPDVIRLGTGLQDAVNGAVPTLAQRMKQIADLPPGQYPFTFFPIRNEGFFEDDLDATKVAGYSKRSYVNTWEFFPLLLPAGGPTHSFHVDSSSARGFVVAPQFYLWWVLERIYALAGYRIESSWLASEEIQRLVIVNMTAMKQSIGSVLTDPLGLIQGHKVTAGMHLPDMSVSDFLKAIKGRFGLVFGFNANTRTCYMERFIDVVRAGMAIDLTQFQIATYDTDQADGKGYSVQEAIDSSDKLFQDVKGNSITPASYLTGEGGQSVALKCGTTQMAYEASGLSGAGKWLVPTVLQAGNILDPAYKASDRYLNQQGERPNDIGLKLLTYRGMTQDSKGAPYPLATNDVRDGRQAITGSQALTLSGRYGAWRQYLRAYYFFRDNTQPISVQLLLPVTVLSSLELFRAVGLTLEDQILRMYLVQKMQAQTPGISGKAIVRLDVLTLPPGIDQAPDIDAKIVWVELLVTEVYSEGPHIPIPKWEGIPIFSQKAATLTLKCWADQARTIPATVQSLPVNIRVKQTFHPDPDNQYQPNPVYTEQILTTTVVTGPSQDVEGAFYTQSTRWKYEQLLASLIENYTCVFSLDPGEGYNLL